MSQEIENTDGIDRLREGERLLSASCNTCSFSGKTPFLIGNPADMEGAARWLSNHHVLYNRNCTGKLNFTPEDKK